MSDQLYSYDLYRGYRIFIEVDTENYYHDPVVLYYGTVVDDGEEIMHMSHNSPEVLLDILKEKVDALV